jgi:hypothetical protein
MLDRGFIINCTHDTALRFLPPFIITSNKSTKLRALREGGRIVDVRAQNPWSGIGVQREAYPGAAGPNPRFRRKYFDT